MGFFSWVTSDTHRSISNKYSDRGALPVYVYCPDGRKIYEPDYEGYGDFGGEDIYALVARWNCPEKCCGNPDEDRSVGIDIACYDEQNFRLKYPIKIAESPDLSYEDLEPSIGDPMQGYFYGDLEPDEDELTEIESRLQFARRSLEKTTSKKITSMSIDELLQRTQELIKKYWENTNDKQ